MPYIFFKLEQKARVVVSVPTHFVNNWFNFRGL